MKAKAMTTKIVRAAREAWGRTEDARVSATLEAIAWQGMAGDAAKAAQAAKDAMISAANLSAMMHKSARFAWIKVATLEKAGIAAKVAWDAAARRLFRP
jgi:hypothetical protein